MATRLYGLANNDPGITPAFGAWTATTGAVRRLMRIAAASFNGKQAATETRAGVAITSGANNNALGFQLISDPLHGAQTVSGTVTIVTRGRELATTDNVGQRIRQIIVVSGDGNTVRGTALALGAHSVTTELGTTVSGYPAVSALALTSVSALDGDRIVVELGYGLVSTGTTPQYDMVIGGNGTDHANSEGDTTGTVPWVEFSANLLFDIPLTVQNVTQAQVEDNVPLGVNLVVQNVVQAQKVSNVLGPGVNPPSWVSQTLVNTSALSGVVDISGAPTGDWVYAFTVIAASQTGNIAAGAGGEWTTLVEGNQSTATHYALHRRKKVAGDTTFTFTWDTSQKATILLSSWPGLDGTTPEDTVSGSNVLLHSAASGNYPTPSLTPAATGRWAAVWAWLRSTSASPGSLDWIADAALVERNDQSTSSSRWVSIELSDSNGIVTVAAHSYTPTNADTAESNGGAVLVYLAPPSTGTDLVLGAVTQAQVEQNLALTQVHELAVQGAVQGQVEGNIALTQVHELVVQGAVQGQVESNVVLALTTNLVVQSPVQGQSTTSVVLSQVHVLIVQGTVQGQVEQNLVLIQQHNLTVQGAIQAQVEGNVVLGLPGALVVQGVTQAQVVPNKVLTQVHVLTVQGVTQGQVTTQISFTGATNLVMQNAVQAQVEANIILVRIYNLVMQSMIQAQVESSPVLVRIFNLIVQGAVSGQISSTIVLIQLHQLVVQGLVTPQVLATIVLATGALPLVRKADGGVIQRYGGGTVLRQGSGEVRPR